MELNINPKFVWVKGAFLLFFGLFPFFIYFLGDPLIYLKYSIKSHDMIKATYFKYFTVGLLLWVLIQILRKRIRISSNRINWIIMAAILFLGLAVTSTVFSVDPKMSVNGYTHRNEGLLAFIGYIGVFLFAAFMLVEEKHQRLMLLICTWSSVIVSVYGILQHFRVDFYQNYGIKDNLERAYAFFSNPNFFSTYLILHIILAMALYLTDKRTYSLWSYSIIICLQVTALIYTYTRSGLLALGFSIVLLSLWIYARQRSLWLRWGILVCLIIAIITALTIVDGTQKGLFMRATGTMNELKHISEGEGGKAGSSRAYIWKKSLDIIPQYLWLGSGPDTFALVFPDIPSEKQQYLYDENIIVDKAHNELLQLLVTLGLPAVLAYIALVSGVLIRSWRELRRRTGSQAVMSVCLMVVICAYLVQAMFNISVVTVAPYFWMLLGLCYARTRTS
ncbi:O-antigen ligase family protein [Gorillibacterium sp. sgz5001074]|uniref:O-antigen ligase family protein n=1 Tax=Gorillibacterium sp. sgz5001074 TaxID=3446695 RepID=UPI003F663431